MQTHFYTIDWIVLAAYFLGVLGIGLVAHRRSRSSEQFTAGGRSLSGWLTGLSIFATYLSSISYLALPGKSFVGDWNPFVYSLAIPVGVIAAVRWFLPYYRSSGEVSAYAMLERRFGVWARIYGSVFYLLIQVARMGVVMYLMALPMAVIFGWDIRVVILVTGVVVTIYSFAGGIVAVVWTDALQAIVLLIGVLVAIALILLDLPGGPQQVFEIAQSRQKLSLGSYDPFDLANSTVWVVLFYGLAENFKNFGVDQSYVQRYIASRSDSDARQSILLGGLLYVPVSAMFFFIGTALFAFYHTHPGELPEVKEIVARQRLMQQGADPVYLETAAGREETVALAATLQDKDIGDRVFPHFIAKHLPPGLTGLLIAAIFAAAMSTVSTSLNSSATLVMSDFYRRLINPGASDRRLVTVLHGATVVWGVFGTGTALLLVRLTDSALDIWWTASSVLSGGIVGLFLLGLISRRAGNPAAVTGVLAGTLTIAWMVLSNTGLWPAAWSTYKSPFHNFLVAFIGTLVILLVGWAASHLFPPRKPS